MRALAIVVLLGYLACCSQPEVVVLQRCWQESELHEGDIATGRAIALYSPDGPLLLSNFCQDSQFIAIFSDKQLERSTLNAMLSASRGEWHGGQGYLVEISGTVGRESERFDGLELSIDRISILGRWEPSPAADVR